MAIHERTVKNKRNASGELTGKAGTVYDPEFPVKIYPTRNMGEEDEKSGEEAGKFGKKYAFQKARSRLKYNLSYFGGERDGKYHPAACWKIHISL